MAALTATGWTVVVEDRNIEGKKKRNRCKLTLATTGTYPSNGIPQPTFGPMGMVRNIDYLIVTDADSTALNPIKYDQANKTFRVHVATATSGSALTELATTATAGTGGSFILYVEAVGW